MVRVIPMFVLASLASARSISQVHLGLTNAVLDCPNGISVAFSSDDADPVTVSLFAGDGTNPSDDVALQTAQSASHIYQSPHKTYTSPPLHVAYLCNLAPNTAYAYSIDDGDAGFRASFTTPAAVGSRNDMTILGVVGDTDMTPTTYEALALAYKNQSTQAIIVVGDWAYANGNHKKWDQWFDAQQPVFSNVPVLGINGNHEVVIPSIGHSIEKYNGYLNRVVTPITADARANLRTYYSFDIGLVHAVFLDDYAGLQNYDFGSDLLGLRTIGSAKWVTERQRQLEWFEADLKAVDRATTPYVVVYKHNGYYNTYTDHQCQCSKAIFEIDDPAACWKGKYHSGLAFSEPHCGQQAKFEDLYVRYGVQVVFSGHCHGYERTDAIVKNKINKEKGVVYVTTGAGGRGHGGSRIANPPAWSRKTISDTFGASRVIATKDKMQIVWLSNDDPNTAQDSFEILPRQTE
ncbi:Aste57867_12547 [Aphanomyces stellatus]|uniref:Purple acid phosphatase n=1 Tax=Aphanomyces stellatus TaxID=120398 RepID=A0A485KVW3_9STRA|nr:hypothetical protein As57867_012501 [Aphanomyces stellatus]VFT89398.1 Aste57867_12547 [Aphanomyces stellatus]